MAVEGILMVVSVVQGILTVVSVINGRGRHFNGGEHIKRFYRPSWTLAEVLGALVRRIHGLKTVSPRVRLHRLSTTLYAK